MKMRQIEPTRTFHGLLRAHPLILEMIRHFRNTVSLGESERLFLQYFVPGEQFSMGLGSGEYLPFCVMTPVFTSPCTVHG